jgi:1,4-dihydroxy-2-naphthoyl-CoA hydrolase
MTIWFQEPTSSQLNKQCNSHMIQHLGIEITKITANTLTGTLPVDHRNQQPFGYLHGGASAVLAETLGSIASNLCLDISRYRGVGQSIFANHIKGVKQGLITGVATPLHLGKKSHVWSIEMVNEKKELICSAQLTTAIISI